MKIKDLIEHQIDMSNIIIKSLSEKPKIKWNIKNKEDIKVIIALGELR